ncbi:MAG: biliverdin-producing heme oxygenase [Pedobacter sp.]
MLSENIKDATKPAHLKLEKLVVQQLKGIRTDEDYAAFLKKFYTYFSQVEKVIAPYITDQLLPDHAERRNSSFIKADIQILGGSVDETPVVEVPVVSNAVEALGALYVMEGSIMGGRIIIQMLEKLGIQNGLSFFSGYGQETGQKWGVFTEVMNEAAATSGDEEQAISTANETFGLFEKVFA